MKRYLSTIFTITLASAILLTSCAKVNTNGNDADWSPLSFGASAEGTLDVKGSFATEVTSFTAAGYDGSSPWFPLTSVTTTGTYADYKWKSGKSYTFYGYANMPSSASTAEASITKDGVSLNYKAVPTDASAQNDILLGHYSGNGGGTGTAAMTFYHPLASVVFTVGEIEGISKITSISIKGVYSTGEVEFSVSDSTPAYSWSECSGSTTVSQTITGNLPAKNAQLGEPFILIPQSFTSPAKIKIQMSATTTAGEDQVIISELAGIALEAGKKTVLAVSYSAQHGLNFTSSLIAWNNTAEQEMDLEKIEIPVQPSNEIWYKTTDGNSVKFNGIINSSGTNISSSQQNDEEGEWLVARFSSDIDKFYNGSSSTTSDKVTSLLVPPATTTMGNVCMQSTKLSYLYLPQSVISCAFQMFSGANVSNLTIETPAGTFTFVDGNTTITLGNGTEVKLTSACFVKGTPITLADGSTKPVEELTYDDDLLVWNFDEGHYDSAKLLWITAPGLIANHYYKVTFSDGTILKLCGPGHYHKLFNYTDKIFEYANDIEEGKEVFTEDGIVTIVSRERIEEEVEYYNLITKKHINCFAEGVLAASHFNNVYSIDEGMKFVKDGRKIRPWREFRKAFKKAGIGKDWYEGVRLYEQPDSLDDVVNRLAKKEALRLPRPEQPGFFARIWNWIKGLFSK